MVRLVEMYHPDLLHETHVHLAKVSKVNKDYDGSINCDE